MPATMTNSAKRLTERVVSPSVSVDATRGVARGVKILGPESRNGRRYTESCMRAAVGLYEGARVNVDHPEGDPQSTRSYADRFGSLKNVRYVEGRGLYGDLHFNPKHRIAEQFAWDAEHAPANVGLSHNVLAKTSRMGNGTKVDSITRVVSVDVVADPATNRSLYESIGRGGKSTAAILREAQSRPSVSDVDVDRAAGITLGDAKPKISKTWIASLSGSQLVEALRS